MKLIFTLLLLTSIQSYACNQYSEDLATIAKYSLDLTNDYDVSLLQACHDVEITENLSLYQTKVHAACMRLKFIEN